MNISGNKLRIAIKSADLTQQQAAERLGTTRQTLGVWFKYAKLTPEILQNVKDNLNIDLTKGGDSAPLISSDSRKGVPYYDIDFIGGFDLVYQNQIANPSYYIDFLPFNNADYWINVTGKSMGPLIAHGDIVALKEVKDWQSFLLMGDIYAIITKNDLRTIKILEAGSDKDHYTLVPYNEKHKSQEIPKKVITHVFKVIGCIKKFF